MYSPSPPRCTQLAGMPAMTLSAQARSVAMVGGVVVGHSQRAVQSVGEE